MSCFQVNAQGHASLMEDSRMTTLPDSTMTLPAAYTGVSGSTERVCVLLRVYAAALWPHHEPWRSGHFPHLFGLRKDHSWCACSLIA